MLSVIKFKLHSNLNISDSHSREEYLQSLKMEQHICIDTLDLKKSKYDSSDIIKDIEKNFPHGGIKVKIVGPMKLDWMETFLDTASLIGKRSHCVSKKVACLITRDDRIISTGINGTPRNMRNCDSLFDESDFDTEAHHQFSRRYEIHAEINALISAARNGIAVDKADLFVNYSPCQECAKAIVASGVKSVNFRHIYRNDLYGFLFLALCANDVDLSFNQVVEWSDTYELCSNLAVNTDILNDIGKYLPDIHPFSVPTEKERLSYQGLKLTPASDNRKGD